jgi:hypothetical protein
MIGWCSNGDVKNVLFTDSQGKGIIESLDKDLWPTSAFMTSAPTEH